MTATWKDISSYSRNDPEPRAPQSWQIDAGTFRIVVTRHRDYEPDQWVLRFDGSLYELKAKDIETAKAQAVAFVRARLTRALEELP